MQDAKAANSKLFKDFCNAAEMEKKNYTSRCIGMCSVFMEELEIEGHKFL